MQEMTHRHTREMDIFYNEHHSACTSCKRLFSDSETAHLGYLKNGTPALLCNQCSPQLEETVVRYYWRKRFYTIPEPTDLLWRYMDLSKFISLISKHKLYFAAAKCFSDPFEGAKGILQRKEKWDTFYLNFLKNAIQTVPETNPSKLIQEDISIKAQQLLDDLHTTGEVSREQTFINCWHMSEFESEAMWKLYSKDITNAIVIQSTYERLYEALGKDPYICIGKVEYIDYSKNFSPINDAFWCKRKSFEYEKEVRAIVQCPESTGKLGIELPVNIEALIENLYVSPYASSWFYEVVQSVIEKYDLKKSILQSQMKVTPFF